jgi:hypothetical protein
MGGKNPAQPYKGILVEQNADGHAVPFSAMRYRMNGAPPGILDDSAGTFDAKPFIDVIGDLFRRVVIGVVENALYQDARVLDYQVSGTPACNPFHVKALRPVNLVDIAHSDILLLEYMGAWR